MVGTPFGVRFQQPTDFYSEDIAQEQLRLQTTRGELAGDTIEP